MDTGKALAARWQHYAVRGLVKGPMPSLIVTGTLALAGFGASALHATPTSDTPARPSTSAVPHSTTLPGNCNPELGGDGTLICTFTTSQLSGYSAYGRCAPEYDGTSTCDFQQR